MGRLPRRGVLGRVQVEACPMSTPPLASVPPLSVLTPFAVAFTAPTFRHVQVLVSGTLLASGRRTVAAALRAVGLGEERRFTTYHRVLNRGVWSALVPSRLLLDLLGRGPVPVRARDHE